LLNGDEVLSYGGPTGEEEVNAFSLHIAAPKVGMCLSCLGRLGKVRDARHRAGTKTQDKTEATTSCPESRTRGEA
jgi:hypothetical protein